MLRRGMVAEEKRWMKRVSYSRFRKWMRMRARVRDWREEGPEDDEEVYGRVR